MSGSAPARRQRRTFTHDYVQDEPGNSNPMVTRFVYSNRFPIRHYCRPGDSGKPLVTVKESSTQAEGCRVIAGVQAEMAERGRAEEKVHNSWFQRSLGVIDQAKRAQAESQPEQERELLQSGPTRFFDAGGKCKDDQPPR